MSACSKVIGARYYSKGAEANLGRRIDRDFYSCRDVDGHGSHTASTAAGREVANVSFFGIAPGTATGESETSPRTIIQDSGSFNRSHELQM